MMKTINIIIPFILYVITLSCSNQTTPASFPGGRDSLELYVEKHLKWPYKRQNIKGKVFVRCNIDTDGKIKIIKIEKGLDAKIDSSVIDLIKNMPQWNPAKKGMKKVADDIVIPINVSY